MRAQSRKQQRQQQIAGVTAGASREILRQGDCVRRNNPAGMNRCRQRLRIRIRSGSGSGSG
eukprot:762585-Hanusia_phi.AAC.1